MNLLFVSNIFIGMVMFAVGLAVAAHDGNKQRQRLTQCIDDNEIHAAYRREELIKERDALRERYRQAAAIARALTVDDAARRAAGTGED